MKRMFSTLSSLSAAVLAATAALWGPPAAAQEEEKVLNVYNWSDYIAEDTLKNFEKETGIKVRYDNFDNNEIVHAKLVAGKTGYDVVVPSSYWAKIQADGGLLMKLDKSKMPNYKNLDPTLQEQLAKLDPGNQYQVNWLWGYTTVGINVEKVKAALGGMPMPDNAWDLVFKPEYISKLKGCGVSFLDSATEVIPAALHYLGKPAYSKTQADYAGVAPLLKSVRPYVTLFSSSGYINDMANGSICVALGWSGDINIARQRAIEEACKPAHRCAKRSPRAGPTPAPPIPRIDHPTGCSLSEVLARSCRLPFQPQPQRKPRGPTRQWQVRRVDTGPRRRSPQCPRLRPESERQNVNAPPDRSPTGRGASKMSLRAA